MRRPTRSWAPATRAWSAPPTPTSRTSRRWTWSRTSVRCPARRRRPTEASTTSAPAFDACAGPGSRAATRRAGRRPLRADEAQLAQARRLLGGDGIATREAGVAEAAPLGARRRRVGARPLDRLVEPLEGHVAQRVGADELADLLDAVAGSDQLLARGRVDAVAAGALGRRRADAQVDLARAGRAD